MEHLSKSNHIIGTLAHIAIRNGHALAEPSTNHSLTGWIRSSTTNQADDFPLAEPSIPNLDAWLGCKYSVGHSRHTKSTDCQRERASRIILQVFL